MNANEKAIRKRVRDLMRSHWDIMINEILEAGFIPPGIASDEAHQRFGDDTILGSITVMMGQDTDMWIEIFSDIDPDHMAFTHRFRTSIGGGQSLRTRTALLILAKAIQLDNQKRPQERPRRPSP